MAGGYRPPRSGVEGVAEKFAEIFRRLDALSSAAGVTSVQVRNGLFTITDDEGDPIAQFGVIPTVVVAEDDTVTTDYLLGSRYFGPGEALLFTVGTVASSGTKVAQFGSAVDLTALPIFRIFADDIGINSNDFDVNNSGDISVTAGGHIALGSGTGTFIQHSTTGSAANARIESNGEILRSTSSLRYKQDVEDVTIDPEAFLNLRPRTWRDKLEVEKEPATTTRHIGFIAEEVDELGLPFVEYDQNGDPEALMYERFSVGAVQVMKAQQAQIDALAERIAALEG